MAEPLSLLVVDVSNSWEDALKDLERGYWIDDEYWKPERFAHKALTPEPHPIFYPFGPARAGIDAIIDTAKLASRCGLTIYNVDTSGPWNDDELGPCDSLKPYIPKENWYVKCSYSAMEAQYCDLPARLEADKCEHLLVVGYDRDWCVLETIKGAVDRGIKVVTSEHCMLTLDLHARRDSSLAYYRQHTTFLTSLPDVWNYLHQHRVQPSGG